LLYLFGPAWLLVMTGWPEFGPQIERLVQFPHTWMWVSGLVVSDILHWLMDRW
jgi:hypothetical protein